jgi:hypothetical protein
MKTTNDGRPVAPGGERSGAGSRLGFLLVVLAAVVAYGALAAWLQP